jgi:hypothetical protein
MNVECTNNGSFSGELHHRNELSDTQGWPGTLSPVFARSENSISALSLLRPGKSCSRALPKIDSECVGSSWSSARLDLHLGQGDTRTQENLHPLYGEPSAAYLQPRGDTALHYWWTLPRYTEGNRRLNDRASKTYRAPVEVYYECFDQAQHERKNSHDLNLSSVRSFDELRTGSEVLEG